ncbi:MAG: hypothetical protein H0W86_07905 [Armatimonadetes bacterium]|nr:hypothetical protein [Armatimonadota bacterium]
MRTRQRRDEREPVKLDADEHALAQTLLSETREELTRADGKASLMLAALGIGLSAILSAILAGDWSPFKLHRPYELLWWLGSGWAGASLLSLCLAIFPKLRHKADEPGITYFGDVAKLGTVADLRAGLKKSETDPRERTLVQLHVLARLVNRKYRFIGGGLIALGLAIALTLSAVLGEHLR